MAALAYSYLRFSSPQQAAGDSVRRQTEATADWCSRNKVALDTSLNLRDEGVSAFRGKHRENPDVHGLAAFLAAVKTGRVPQNSYLVVENLDRLSRESIVPAVHLFTGILMSGVRIVQLKPVEQVFTSGADMTAIMLALVELSRGNSESKMKSERVGAAWRQKKANAANRVLTRMTPGWIRCDGDKLVLDKAKAASVRRVFALAREGYGIGKIAKIMNTDKVPVLGRTEFRGRALLWSVNVVYSVLTNRATYGEYQPHVGSRGPERKPAGPPVPNYYPAVITKEEYEAVRGILATRATVGRGRRGKHVNLFAGLLKDARTGGSLTSRHVGNRSPVLIPVESRTTAGSAWASFGLKQFEQSVRSELAEVKADDIAPKGNAGDLLDSLRDQLAGVEALAAKWRAKMSNPLLVDAVAAELEKIEARRRELVKSLGDAECEAANPLSESWKQARAAGKALANDDSDEARERYRTAIRRAVDSVWVLILPCNGSQKSADVRLAAVQVWFKSGAHRDYLIGYKPGRGVQPGVVLKPRSFDAAGLPPIDLRDRKQVAELEKELAEATRGIGTTR